MALAHKEQAFPARCICSSHSQYEQRALITSIPNSAPSYLGANTAVFYVAIFKIRLDLTAFQNELFHHFPGSYMVLCNAGFFNIPFCRLLWVWILSNSLLCGISHIFMAKNINAVEFCVHCPTQRKTSANTRSSPRLHYEEHCKLVEAGDPSLFLSNFESHLQRCVQFWAPSCKQDTDVLQLLQCRSLQRWLRDRSISATRRGWESWDYSAWRWAGSGRLLTINTWGRKGSKEDGARFFIEEPKEMTRSNGHKLKYRKFDLKIRNSI